MITTIFGSSFMQNFAKWIRLEESINKAETEPMYAFSKIELHWERKRIPSSTQLPRNIKILEGWAKKIILI